MTGEIVALLCLAVYGFGGGVTLAVMMHVRPNDDGAGAVFGAAFWPVGLPAVLGYLAVQRACCARVPRAVVLQREKR